MTQPEQWNPDGCLAMAPHLYGMQSLGPAQCHLEPGHQGPHGVDVGTPDEWQWGGPELDSVTDDDAPVNPVRLDAAECRSPEHVRVATLADWDPDDDCSHSVAANSSSSWYARRSPSDQPLAPHGARRHQLPRMRGRSEGRVMNGCWLCATGSWWLYDLDDVAREFGIDLNDEPCMCGAPFACLADEHPGFGEDAP